MPLNPSGQISIGGSTVGQSINLELGRAATATSSLNESALRTLAGVPSGAISLSNFYGKSNQFSFSIAASTNNLDLRTAAVNAGWNQSTKVVATINGGVTISSTSTGSAAMTISGSFPGGVELINNGTIIGRGGNGGRGGGFAPSPPTGGTAAGTGLSVSTAVSITNNGTVAGGGGGGGGGGNRVGPRGIAFGGGGGGGGRGGSTGGPAAIQSSYYGQAGQPGTTAAAGNGGAGAGPNPASLPGVAGGPGGAGGSAGTKGTNGNTATPLGFGGAGGAAGSATSGGGNITWLVNGTRLGPLN